MNEQKSLVLADSIMEKEIDLEKGLLFPMGKEGGFWRVLKVDYESQTALLISEKIICEGEYPRIDCSWEKSDLRSWLNCEFYDTAFTEKEREAIVESEQLNPDCHYEEEFGEYLKHNTKDKVFLLSVNEAEEFFEDANERATGGTWFLRSPGYDYTFAFVDCDGNICYGGTEDEFLVGVRPAIRINLESEYFKSLISTKTEKTIKVNIPVLWEAPIIVSIGKDNAKWRVLNLDFKERTMLLIMEEPICEKPYHREHNWQDITWENCDLRTWLNAEFYPQSFSIDEKKAIVKCKLVYQYYDYDHDADGAKLTILTNSTEDNVFLLSADEAMQYFKDEEDRIVSCDWWLRSPNGYLDASHVDNDGYVARMAGISLSRGKSVRPFLDWRPLLDSLDSVKGVRPSVKINMDSELFKSLLVCE